MKKILLFAVIVSCSLFAHAQKTCGFDHVQKELEERFPNEKIERQRFEEQLVSQNVHQFLKSMGLAMKSALYNGIVYEVPVVVHIIEPSSSSPFADYTVSDSLVEAWIDRANEMYATKYTTFFPEGTGNYDGTVIPFKLVLAKRDPHCQPTNGIVRVSGAGISTYDQYGVYSSSKGTTADSIRALSPHWNESSYFNIYVVTTFDANTTTYGLMGWCSYPTNSDYYYDSFMKIATLKNKDGTTLAHEFGHGLGLLHPFGDADSSGGGCPSDSDCSVDNDKVCDTEVCQSLLNTYVYSLASVAKQSNNPCTEKAYQGVQYNVMNYTNKPQKFTPGQRERALAVFLQTRGGLINSLGATDLSIDTDISIADYACAPRGIKKPGDFQIGPTRVTFGTIDNSSGGYNLHNNAYFVDYSSMLCLNNIFSTDLELGKSYTLSVSYTANKQWIKAWIDYNNNGVFETSELVADSKKLLDVNSSPFTIAVTPPQNAVLNTYLRMRIRNDWGGYSACDSLQHGQVEDYAVRIVRPTSGILSQSTSKSGDAVLYNQAENKLLFLNQDNQFGQYFIYDLAGNLISSGNSPTNEILLRKRLAPDVYILRYASGNIFFTKKIWIN